MLGLFTSTLLSKLAVPVAAVAGGGLLVLGVLYWRATADEASTRSALATAQTEVVQATAAARQNAETIQILQANLASNAKLLKEAQDREQAATARVAQFSHQLTELRRNDAPTKAWADQPLPPAVRSLLSNPATADHPDAGDSASAAAAGAVHP